MSREGQQITSLELRVSTQKSRIAELEGSLVLAQDSSNKVRKSMLMEQEQVHALEKEVMSRDNSTEAERKKKTDKLD